MTQRIRRHLSFANVTSMLALVFAMGGTGYALTVPRDSVGSAQIKRAGVRNSDIRKSAVTSAKVRNRSLFARDFALGQLPAGPPGAPGATGPAGAAGGTGPQGPAGVVGAVTVQREDFQFADNQTTSKAVTCPAGTKVIGGGASTMQSGAEDIKLMESRPSLTVSGPDGTLPVDGETFDAWRVAYRNSPGVTGTATARVWAICAEASP